VLAIAKEVFDLHINQNQPNTHLAECLTPVITGMRHSEIALATEAPRQAIRLAGLAIGSKAGDKI
jgi:hypothetical protein